MPKQAFEPEPQGSIGGGVLIQFTPAPAPSIMTPRYRHLVLPVVATALIAAGCGGGESTTAQTDPGSAETTAERPAPASAITATDYAFSPADVTVAVGDRIKLQNAGGIIHNLTVNDTEVATENVDPGRSTEFRASLDPGDYTFRCTIGSHADLGMTGTLTVE